MVISVRGFRSMFAGQSQQWQDLSGLIVRSLQKILTQNGMDYLLGKMADDTFALMLEHTDKFLARNIMTVVIDKLEKVTDDDPAFKKLDVMAVDLQWVIGGKELYRNNLVDLLNNLYSRIYSRTGQNESITRHIVLKRQNNEVAACK